MQSTVRADHSKPSAERSRMDTDNEQNLQQEPYTSCNTQFKGSDLPNTHHQELPIKSSGYNARVTIAKLDVYDSTVCTSAQQRQDEQVCCPSPPTKTAPSLSQFVLDFVGMKSKNYFELVVMYFATYMWSYWPFLLHSSLAMSLCEQSKPRCMRLMATTADWRVEKLTNFPHHQCNGLILFGWLRETD